MLAIVLALALQPFGDARAAATTGYRLAGIVAVGSDYLGFLELPGGAQVLVRRGSTIDGGGRIADLNGAGLRIVFADRTIQLNLEGSGAPSVPSKARDTQHDWSNENLLVMRDVSPADLTQLPRTSSGSGKGGDASVAVAQRFASIAKLPDSARVVAVNEQAVMSADAAIRVIEKSLAEGRAVSLKVAAAGDDPVKRVYLMPVAP